MEAIFNPYATSGNAEGKCVDRAILAEGKAKVSRLKPVVTPGFLTKFGSGVTAVDALAVDAHPIANIPQHRLATFVEQTVRQHGNVQATERRRYSREWIQFTVKFDHLAGLEV